MPGRIPIYHPPGWTPPAERKRQYERRPARRDDIAFYHLPEWRRLRAAYLAEHPLCERCEREGRTTAASHVHHVVERKQDERLALAWSNCEALCLNCHSTHHGFNNR